MTFSFHFNSLAVLELLIAVFLLTQGVLVLAQNRRSGLNRSFFLFELSVFVWLMGMGLNYLAADPASALFFSRLGFFGVIYIPVTTYIFSLYYLGDRSQRIFGIVGLVITFFYSLFICASSFF